MIKLIPNLKAPIELVGFYFAVMFIAMGVFAFLHELSGLSPSFLASLRAPVVSFFTAVACCTLTIRKGWHMNLRYPITASWSYWLLAPCAVVGVFLLNALLVSLFPELQVQFRENPTFRLPNLWTAVGTILFAPPVEEYLFRGVMFSTLSQRFTKLVSAFLTTVIFAALHYTVFFSTPEGIVLLILISAMLMLLRIYTKSLGPGILAHMLFNVISYRALFGF